MVCQQYRYIRRGLKMLGEMFTLRQWNLPISLFLKHTYNWIAMHALSAFRNIVAEGQIPWPHQTYPIENYDYVVGQDGIITGVKTGSTVMAGGFCRIFGARSRNWELFVE